MSERFRLLEFTQVTRAREIDEEKGILYDLVALGPTSANGRDYPESTMRAALHLFEGRQSFANHTKKPGDEPSIYDVMGVWRECRVDDGKVRGNFHYFKTHVLAPRLVEAARRPELAGAFGFSISAQGRSRRQGDRQVIESLDQLTSIDCVALPATTKGIYESLETPMKKTIRDLIESLKARRPGYSRGLREVADSGLMTPDAQMDDPGDVPDAGGEAPDHEAALKQGFRGAIMACLDDDGMDLKAKLKKISEILKTEEKLLGGDDSGGKGGRGGKGAAAPDAPDAPDDAKKTEESRRLKLENTGLTLLLESGVKPTKILSKALAGCETEAEMKALIEEAKGSGHTGGKPGARSAPAWHGNGSATAVQEGKIPEDPKKLRNWLQE